MVEKFKDPKDYSIRNFNSNFKISPNSESILYHKKLNWEKFPCFLRWRLIYSNLMIENLFKFNLDKFVQPLVKSDFTIFLWNSFSIHLVEVNKNHQFDFQCFNYSLGYNNNFRIPTWASLNNYFLLKKKLCSKIRCQQVYHIICNKKLCILFMNSCAQSVFFPQPIV